MLGRDDHYPLSPRLSWGWEILDRRSAKSRKPAAALPGARRKFKALWAIAGRGGRRTSCAIGSERQMLRATVLAIVLAMGSNIGVLQKRWFVMKAVHIRSLSLAAVAVFALTASVPAQDKSSAVLNTLEVQRLVKHGEAADSARLAAHFTALADRYAAEARQHVTMSQSFGSNANRGVATGMTAHCKRLADLATESAATLRELATYHHKLAAGVEAPAPSAGRAFEGGAGAPAPTEHELNVLAAKASSPSDHGTLAEYYSMLATRYTSNANDDVALANAYRGTKMATAAVQLDRLATLSRNEAKEAKDAAAMHKKLATGR
jgi:hypothetical protein